MVVLIVVGLLSLDHIAPSLSVEYMADIKGVSNNEDTKYDDDLTDVNTDVDIVNDKELDDLKQKIKDLEDRHIMKRNHRVENVVVKQSNNDTDDNNNDAKNTKSNVDQNMLTDKHIKKLLNLYLNLLLTSGVLSENEIYQIKNKIDSGIFTPKETIKKLEDLMSRSKQSSTSSGYNDWFTEMQKSQLSDIQTNPVGNSDTTLSNKFDHGFSYLDTDRWRLPMPRPPVCVTDNKCEVCPTPTTGYHTDLKEWDSSRYITKSNVHNKNL
jgi:hypothetical protein